MSVVNFVHVNYGGLCTQVLGTINTHNIVESGWKDIESESGDYFGDLDITKDSVMVTCDEDRYQLTNIIHRKFFSPTESRNLALFRCHGIQNVESNILRGFRFPFPMSLHIFYGPILLAFICPESGSVDGLTVNDWSTIVQGWQDLSLMKCGTQDDTLRPFWTSDAPNTEDAVTDTDLPDDDTMEDAFDNATLRHIEHDSDSSIDGYTSHEDDSDDPAIVDKDDDLDDDLEDEGSDIDMSAYYRKTLDCDDM